jgi:hypothetical protein
MTSSENPIPAVEAQGFWRRAWEGWKRLAHKIGVFNTRVIMSLLYFVIVLPMGLVFRLVSDPLHLKEPKDSNWLPLPHHDHAIEQVRQQF